LKSLSPFFLFFIWGDGCPPSFSQVASSK
jgi:hypothetical protein